MKAKINQFLDAVITFYLCFCVGIIIGYFLFFFPIKIDEIHKDKQEMETHHKFRSEHFVCRANLEKEQCKTLCLK